MALWGSCVLQGIILDFTFGGKQLKSPEEGGKSHDQILLCTPSPFLTLLASGRTRCFTGQTCLEHTSTQEWESSRVKHLSLYQQKLLQTQAGFVLDL